MRDVNFIVVHHSASPRDTTTLEHIERWHRERGFAGVGYHWVIEADGTVKAGRPEDRIGAHVAGHNSDSVGVCVVGNNTLPAHRWNGAQWTALLGVLGELRGRFPGAAVLGHRDLPGTRTECPGLDVRPILAADEPLRAAGVAVAGGE